MQTTFRYKSSNEVETGQLAVQLQSYANGGTVIALDGDLGAGKTSFSQSFARAMGVAEPVNSPTFTIIKEYEGMHRPFYHMDVYRISLEEAEELGLEEYFEGSGVSLVEWADRILPLLPADRLHIVIEMQLDGERMFTLTSHGDHWLQACTTLKENGMLL